MEHILIAAICFLSLAIVGSVLLIRHLNDKNKKGEE